jgi:hypothetical protein
VGKCGRQGGALGFNSVASVPLPLLSLACCWLQRDGGASPAYSLRAFWATNWYNCTALTSIVLPKGLTTIGGLAFDGCSALSCVVFPFELTSIDAWAFCGCTALSSIVLPEGLTSIGAWAFYRCTALSSVALPQEGLNEIRKGAFRGCSTLYSISIPESVHVNSLKPDAFLECPRLSELSSAKRMDVEQFLRWRRRAPRQRCADLASLLRLRTELYARPKKRAAVEDEEDEYADEDEGGVDEDGAEEGGGGQGDGGRLQGVLGFDSISSEDVWRYILEFL